MKIFILNRKIKENEEVILLTDSTPDNWRGKDGEKLEGKWMDLVVNKKHKRPTVYC